MGAPRCVAHADPWQTWEMRIGMVIKTSPHLEEMRNYAISVACDVCGDEGISFINLWIFGFTCCHRCHRTQLYLRAHDLLHKKLIDCWWHRIWPKPKTIAGLGVAEWRG